MGINDAASDLGGCAEYRAPWVPLIAHSLLTHKGAQVAHVCASSPHALGMLACLCLVPTCCSGASGASCSCPPGTGHLGCSSPASPHPALPAVYSGPLPSSPSGPLAQGPTDLQKYQGHSHGGLGIGQYHVRGGYCQGQVGKRSTLPLITKRWCFWKPFVTQKHKEHKTDLPE